MMIGSLLSSAIAAKGAATNTLVIISFCSVFILSSL
jgi:hypothetical protein